MKRWIVIIVLILALIGSWFYFKVALNETKEGLREAYKDSISHLERNIENIFILKTRKDLAFDSVRDENIRLQDLRNANKSVWTSEKNKAMAKCDTVFIHTLDSIHLSSEAICDSMLNNKDSQIGFLRSELQLDSTAFDMKDSIIDVYSDVVLDQENQLKKEKRKKIFFKVTSIAATVALIVSLL